MAASHCSEGKSGRTWRAGDRPLRQWSGRRPRHLWGGGSGALSSVSREPVTTEQRGERVEDADDDGSRRGDRYDVDAGFFYFYIYLKLFLQK